LKKFIEVFRDAAERWVGDGFPVRTIFRYEERGTELSPFLLLDYAGPYRFEPASRSRGVSPHPHRGFEKVTIVYDGEVAHRDSTGRGGTIGPGDVQWMTAGAGILHQELHSAAFTRRGGRFCLVQVWVNLPAGLKLTRPRYQSIKAGTMPVIDLESSAGRVRVIAGSFGGHFGPAQTFTPINVWDVDLKGGIRVTIDAPEEHTTLIIVLSGQLTFDGGPEVRDAEGALLSRSGQGALLTTTSATKALILTGSPIEEPIVGRGPFVMNTEAEVRKAFLDFGKGRFGALEEG
jgi:quercetin 2,3-dioxygenase